MDFYAAFNKDKNINLKSSSGGIFYSLASYILNNNGVVFGASWNESWEVDLKYIENISLLKDLIGSKYLTAKINNTYEECKNFLEQGRVVLFSALPCQIHGLKKYLTKDYSNLYCIDICCHGLMPTNIWRDYINSIQKPGNKIININMRDKSLGWDNSTVRIDFEDGFFTIEKFRDNPYMKLYLQDIYLKDSCYDCKFKNSYSKADLIIGDFWNVSESFPQLDTKLGVSFIEVISNKGKDLLNRIKDLNIYPISQQNVSKNNQGLSNKIDISKQRYYTNSFNQDNKVAIYTLPFHSNVGGILQGYALQSFLRENGYSPEFIQIKQGPQIPFTSNYLNCKYFESNSTIRSIDPKEYNNYIIGSDQIWRKEWAPYKNSFLIDIFPNTNKIAYAPSFGVPKWQFNEEETKNIKEALKKFNFLSVRELDMIDLIKTNTDCQPEIVLDPTLLLDISYYKGVCKNIPKKQGIFPYILDNLNQKINNILNISIERKEPIISINSKSVEEWLGAFRDCSCVVTDSYHGCIFSIIFNKPFICLTDNLWRGSSRFETLKKLFNISDRFSNSFENLNKDLLIKAPNINYNDLKLKSKNWLLNALNYKKD